MNTFRNAEASRSRGRSSPKSKMACSSGTWTADVCEPHGGGEVCRLPRQVEIMLGHPGSRVPHEFRKRLDVHAGDNRFSAEGMADAVDFRFVRNASLLSVRGQAAGPGCPLSKASCGD